MRSSTYRDIIDDKITEWQNRIVQLEERTERAASDIKAQLNTKIRQLKSLIDTAKVQLYNLDENENVKNTVETKNKVIEIFGSVDKEFPEYEEKTPFML